MVAFRVVLLVCLALLAACGNGAEDRASTGLGVARGDALTVRLGADGRIRWASTHHPAGGEEPAPTPGAQLRREGQTIVQDAAEAMAEDATWRLRLSPDAQWLQVERILRVVGIRGGVVFEGTGHEHLVHRSAKADPDALSLLVDLAGEDFVIEVRGAPWVRRHGCGEPWGAFDSTDAALTASLDALDGDASRLRVRIGADAAAKAADVLDVWSTFRDAGAGQVDFAGPASGGRRISGAVEEALKWLLAHQSPDGRWESAGFDRWCEGGKMPCADLGVGAEGHDVHATSLALLAFLGAGYTSRGRHPFAARVKKAIRWLEQQEGDDEGRALAAFALTQHLGMIDEDHASPALVQVALDRLSGIVAWAEGDLRTLGWALAAFATARSLIREREARDRPQVLVLDPDLEAALRKAIPAAAGREGVRGDALALFGSIVLGEDPRKSEAVSTLAERVTEHLPEVGSLDPWYVFLATQGVFQVGGSAWKTWNEQVKAAVVDTCVRDGSHCCRRGSWDAFDGASMGGRLEATALLAMTLQVYYHYRGLLQGG